MKALKTYIKRHFPVLVRIWLYFKRENDDGNLGCAAAFRAYLIRKGESPEITRALYEDPHSRAVFDEIMRVTDVYHRHMIDCCSPIGNPGGIFSKIRYCKLHRPEDYDATANEHMIAIGIRDRFHLPIDRVEIASAVFHHGLKVLPDRIKERIENGVIIDGGAYCGDSAVIFAEYYRPRLIIAFEPDPQNNDLLHLTIERNFLKTVIPDRKALWNTVTKVSFFEKENASFIGIGGRIEIDTITVDRYCQLTDIRPALIKLDVEGNALQVLEGARETILKYRPILSIAIYHNGEEFFGVPQRIKEWVPEYNLLLRRLNSANPIIETALIAWTD